MWKLPASLPLAPGGALGDALGQGLAHAIGFNGATLLLLALFAVGSSLLFGISWLKVMERIGAGIEYCVGWIRRRREEAVDRRIGDDAAFEREQIVAHVREVEVERVPVVVVPAAATVPKSERVVKEKQRPLFTDMPDSPLPPLALLEDAPSTQESVGNETLEYTSRLIERKLADFGVSAKVLAAYPGPVITRYEIEPAVGVKGAQIVNLIKDIARALSVVSIRVVETIPGKSCMGLELPNPRRQVVKLVEILASTTYNDTPGVLTLALGKDIAGKPVVADLARMPHLLVAGTTGSGKSVAVNAMILSLLYKAEPKQVRLILIDPKMLELSMYEGIPHLLAPVVTNMKLAPNALNWCVGEMERRYKLMSMLGVRNLSGYNAKIIEARKSGRKELNPLSMTPEAPEPLEEMPLIVVVVDELADLMMVTGKKIEELIARIAQKARAAGIHLILATQRPVGGCHHRTHQGQHSVAHRVPGREQDRLAHDPGPDGRRSAAGTGRHALHAAGYRLSAARARRVRLRRRSASRGRAPEAAGRAAVHRRAARRRYGRPEWRGWRVRRRCRRRVGPHVRPGGRRRAQDAPAVDFPGTAALAHRLQPRGATYRADGKRGTRVADADQRQQGSTGTRRQGRRLTVPRHGAALVAFAATLGHAGPVEVYREGPELCPRDVAKTSPVLTQAQAIARARAMLPAGFCGPSLFVSGCDVDPEFELGAWRMYFHQYNDRAGRKDRGGLVHTYIILDSVGNCVANIPGTEPGAPR